MQSSNIEFSLYVHIYVQREYKIWYHMSIV